MYDNYKTKISEYFVSYDGGRECKDNIRSYLKEDRFSNCYREEKIITGKEKELNDLILEDMKNVR